MKVELIAYTKPFSIKEDSNPMDIVEKCASVCYDSDITKEYRIAKSCHDSGHLSIYEHINFTFHIQGVSRSLLAQLSRHRHISLSVRSTRYCNSGNIQIPYFPPVDKNFKNRNDFTENQRNIIRKLYKDGYSSKEISKFVKVSHRSIYELVKTYGEERNLSESKFIKHDFFDRIDSPTKAYILGMIYTDGNISEKIIKGRVERSFSITQLKSERVLMDNILFQIKKFGNLHKGGHDNSTIKVQINSSQICNKLIQLGITPQKALNISPNKIIDILPENLIRHFVRGIFEGDGCVRYTKDKNGYGSYTFSITGTEHTVRFIKDFFMSRLNVGKNVNIIKRKSDNSFSVSYGSKNEITTILEYLYDNIDFNFVHLRKICIACKFSPKIKEDFMNEIRNIIHSKYHCTIPESFNQNPNIMCIYLTSCYDSIKTYDKIVYNEALNGLTGESAYEKARMILPLSTETELYMTANARALIEMSYLRMCFRAEREIRTMFQEIKKQVDTVCPEVATYMIPKCEKNSDYPFCDERKSCGRHKSLKEVYNKENTNIEG